MTIITVWIILSSIGFAFNAYELFKSRQYFNLARKEGGSVKAIALDALVRVFLLTLLFVDLLFVGILAQSMILLDVSLVDQDHVRNTVIRPLIVGVIVLLIGKSAMHTYTRKRLEQEVK